ncbi:hypothetical protein BpHYR1_048186 [Brachionus plicatilis]|uniref:Uncharacterized protein n=1 Tax=Brachionus plicatilis TaxID=10195 RepID=A0A3M7RZI3_BRAPC|nr:hypothetical protein BpHYR1_048186 [Brachionus plicatilis]
MSTESDKIFDPKNWPTGIHVKRFLLYKINSQKIGSMNNENPENSYKHKKQKENVENITRKMDKQIDGTKTRRYRKNQDIDHALGCLLMMEVKLDLLNSKTCFFLLEKINTTPISKSNKESPDVSKPKKEQEQRQLTYVNNPSLNLNA